MVVQGFRPSRSPTSRNLRNLSKFLIAFLLPIAIAVGVTDFLPPLLQGVTGLLSLLAVALTARFLGFLPAIGATLSFAAVQWFHVWPAVYPGRPPPFFIVRLVLFVTVATLIASISRRKEREVREADEMYRSLVELAPDGIGISDDQGQVLFVNDALVRLLGARERSELIGRRWADFIHPDFQEAGRKQISDLVAGISAPPIDLQLVTLDGRSVDVETAGVPVHRNKRLLLQGFVRDLTERKKTAAKLEETARRMEALFSAALDAIVLVDSTGRYVDANPAASALLGYTREEILSRSLGDFAPADKKAAIAAIWNDAKSSRHLRGEFANVRKDGEVRNFDYAIVSNVLPGLHCAFMRDITERKAAELSVRQLSARLLQLQDAERRRIARQLHDTTAQNLAALLLHLANIKRSPAASDSAIREAVDESLALTEQSVAEIRTLAYLLHPPMIEEAGLLASLRWYVQGFEERSGLQVILELPPALEPLPLELATTLFRIVQEAMTNVQRHSGSPVARIRLERQPRALHLEIEDQGHGLPESLRQDETWFLASGVGIAAMRERVREHGGHMHITSQDSGTVVSVTLPLPEH